MSDRIMERNEMMQDWRMCCRLCAKEDMQTNIDVFLDGQDMITVSSVEHLFGICIRQSEDLPHMLCTECLTLLNALSTFTERVSKVQTMFRWLQEHDMSGHVNLSDARVKFGLFDEEREHLVFMQPITEVQCNESKPGKIQLNADVQVQNGLKVSTKERVKLEEYLLEEVNEEMHEIIGDEEDDEEMAEDPFHTNESDACMTDIGAVFTENGENDDDATDKVKAKLPSGRRKYLKNAARPTRQRTKRKLSATALAGEGSVEAGAESGTIYECKDCSRKFKRLQQYRQHMKRAHAKSAEMPGLQCEQCPRVFKIESKLDRHVKAHLPVELKKVLPCPYCDKKFTTNCQVQSHIKCIHMNERPFVCEECGITVRTNSSLKTHMLTHTDSAPFICDVCDKGFKDHTRLKKHKEIHDPNKYICAECGLQLNSRTTLNRHLLVHSDEMKHKCDYCGRAFKRGKALKNHLILHTGLKPYSCDFCDRTFANGSNCRSHKKKAHPKELADLEASGGGKAYTRNIPKLDALKAVTKAADNLTPVVSKQSGRFAFGKKPKPPLPKDDRAKSPSSPPASKSADANASNSSADRIGAATTTSIPTIDNIYSHILKHATDSDAADTALPLDIKRSPSTLEQEALSNSLSQQPQKPQQHFFHAVSATLSPQQKQEHFSAPNTATNSPNSQSSSTPHPAMAVNDDSGNNNAQDERTIRHYYNQIRSNLSESYM